MSEAHDDELTTTPVDNFVDFMKFIANNDLWDAAKTALAAAGVETVKVSSEPIRVIRKLIDDELLPGERLSGGGRRHALVISECGCGVASPGPPGGAPQFPTTDAGTPDATTQTTDAGGGG